MYSAGGAVAVWVLAQAVAFGQYQQPPSEAIASSDTVVVGAPLPLDLRTAMLGRATLPLERQTHRPFANDDAAPPPVHRALFCRFDDDLDRKRIPLRMRLGDLETVNKKEGKPGW